MRETEFRGFHIGGGGQDIVRISGPDGGAKTYLGRWLTGSLVRWADGDASLLRSDPDDDRDHLSQYFVLPETVGEWTGYCDKNGRRIYEGDRVRLSGDNWTDAPETAEIELHAGCWCASYPGVAWCFLVAKVKDAEVIGTVYDPEVTGAAAE